MTKPAAAETGAERLLVPMKFSQRILKYTLIPHHFRNFFEHGDLRERIVNHQMQGVDELIEQFHPDKIAGMTEIEVEALKAQHFSEMEAHTRQEVDEYLPILYNQALVMMVTVFDVFLYESLKIVTNTHPQILKSMADEKDITVMQIIDLADYHSIFKTIQDRVVKRFDYKGITEKIDALRKLRVDVDAALRFEFHTVDIQQRYSESLKLLRSYYDKRHAVVHREQTAFDTYEQLEKAGTFFNKLILSLGFALGFRFDIMTDFEKIIGRHPKRPRT